MSQSSIRATRIEEDYPNLKKFYMHTHSRYELYCFLSGEADFYVEGTVYPLQPGDILLMARSEAHCLKLRSQDNYCRIVVHFSPEDILGTETDIAHIRRFLDGRPLGKGNHFPGALQKRPDWQAFLDKLLKAEAWARQVYLTALLHEIALTAGKTEDPAPGQTSGITQIIRYINQNLTQPLNLDLLSQQFFISKAQLNRSFKKVTGSTVWEYIQTKRLLLAKELLRTGTPPTQVSTQCGFGNYCSFYRAYRKQFGFAPNQEIARQKDGAP